MHKIKLQNFEGPLDLLLFFIKRDEMDIYDIPISKITKEFLEYVNFIKELDLEYAGDFILLASTLMHIKAKMLLPREVDEKGEIIDPRSELVDRLLEYKRYKEMAEELNYFESVGRSISFRGNNQYDESVKPADYEILLRNVTVFDLVKAFQKAIKQVKEEPVHIIKKPPVSIDDQMLFIRSKLTIFRELHFLSLVNEIRERIRLVVTFIALLEMIKMQKIGLRPSDDFNDFVVYALEGLYDE